MKRRYTVGVLIGNAHTSHPKGLIKGIFDRVKGENLKVIFFLGTQTNNFYRDMIREDYDYQYNTIYDYAMLGQMDVLIIAYGSLCIFREDSDLNEFLARFGDIPYVLLEDISPKERGVHLIADNYGGMRMCVRHLLEHHHYREICYLSGPKGNRDAMERLNAYRDVMQEHGIPVRESMIRYGNFSEKVDEQVEMLLDENPGAEAIVSANDEMTVGIYRVLKKRGLEIGKDVAVTGFDNTDMSGYAVPTLTTVTQDSYRMGERAVELALAICEGREVKSERLESAFIPRESCGCGISEGEQVPSERAELRDRPDWRSMVMELREFQRKSWLVPFIMRDLMMETEDERLFFARAAQTFHSVGAENLYIYVLKEPLIYQKGEEWKCPDELFLAAQYVDGRVTAYEKEKRPMAVRGTLWKERKESRHSEVRPQAQVFMNFLLFEGVRQYGILSVEVEPEAISHFFVLALLFGTVLRFFEMGQKESLARRKLKEKNEVLSLVASYDELTGIYNRRGLLEKIIQFNHQYQGRRAYLFIGDLDHLKQINDNYGHVEGDYAIRTVAGFLKEELNGRGDIGRFGGDEFLAVFPADTGDEKEQYVRAIRERCEEFNRNAGKPYYVNISLGVTEFICGEDMDMKETLKKADKLLYQAKKKRRQSVKKEDAPV